MNLMMKLGYTMALPYRLFHFSMNMKASSTMSNMGGMELGAFLLSLEQHKVDMWVSRLRSCVYAKQEIYAQEAGKVLFRGMNTGFGQVLASCSCALLAARQLTYSTAQAFQIAQTYNNKQLELAFQLMQLASGLAHR